VAIRDLVRGTIDDGRLDEIASALARRLGRETVDLEPVAADNWLSAPFVADGEWFVKVITPQHSLVHALFTAGRNVGAFSSGVEGFFEHHDDAVSMAEHEFGATRRLRDAGVPGPEPVNAFGVDDHGVLVVEYWPEFRTVGDAGDDAVAGLAPAIFEALATAHAAGIAHGDLQTENVLVTADGEPAFVDATNVREDEDAIADARAYDLASGLGALEPRIGASDAVRAAGEHYDADAILAARDFLDFVALRPELQFDAGALRSAIDRRVD
jgi:hypothetical protein